MAMTKGQMMIDQWILRYLRYSPSRRTDAKDDNAGLLEKSANLQRL